VVATAPAGLTLAFARSPQPAWVRSGIAKVLDV